MEIIFVTGGARSGKSRFAEKKAGKEGEKVIYIATAQALDEEMVHRISIHRGRRPSTWETLEEPMYLSKVLQQIKDDGKYEEYRTVLIDCMALLTSNWACSIDAENGSERENLRKEYIEEIENMLKLAKSLKQKVIIVSNEVGMGLVPEYPLGRFYRDLLGEVNQIIAAASDEVYFMVSGIPLKIK
ncbi:MAG: bifunctional adenosylcobinamide kinase/adenosylcobinamide-phosphate guanylyltransferase [Bacillota bacterium]|nr:MAG: bifunctional adenosylcobinamide kinase/adenosylcobinamide-phosphate guanylyltransferase [Bacillota bacterium]